jgi:hypothetical protein
VAPRAAHCQRAAAQRHRHRRPRVGRRPRLADVFIAPELDGVEIRDWKAFERAAAAGQLATERALAALDRPVTQSRMRP